MNEVNISITSSEPIPPHVLLKIRNFVGDLANNQAIQIELEPDLTELPADPIQLRGFSEDDFYRFNQHFDYPLGMVSRVRNSILRAAWGWEKSDDERLRALGEACKASQDPDSKEKYLPVAVLQEIVKNYGTLDQVELYNVGQKGIAFLRDILEAHEQSLLESLNPPEQPA